MLDWHYFFWYYLAVWIITALINTIFIHRTHAHRVLDCAPSIHHFCRFWLWATGFHWPNWAQHWSALHRKHHKYSDTELDPHSPRKWGTQMLNSKFNRPGKPYYITREEIHEWAGDVPEYNDWMEHRVYIRFNKGHYVYHAINLILFGFVGFLIGLVLFVPLRKAPMMHNYLSHLCGFRYEKNNDLTDHSVNTCPIGLVWCGEELAANHHNDASLAKFSKRWWEVDVGWGVIKILNYFGLIKILGGTAKV